MNTLFVFIVRRDHIAQLTAHLAAGLVALALLSGMATATPKQISPQLAAPRSLEASVMTPASAADALSDTTPGR